MYDAAAIDDACTCAFFPIRATYRLRSVHVIPFS